MASRGIPGGPLSKDIVLRALTDPEDRIDVRRVTVEVSNGVVRRVDQLDLTSEAECSGWIRAVATAMDVTNVELEQGLLRLLRLFQDPEAAYRN